MRRGTIFILVFIILAGGIIAITQLFRAQPALEIIIAVDPLAERWVREAATTFNTQNQTVGVSRRVRVTVQVISDMKVFSGQSGWGADTHPDGWIPAWSALFTSPSIGAGITANRVTDSLARTTLVWMSPASSPLSSVSWGEVANAVGQNERIAFPLADGSVQGLAALISGAADFRAQNALTEDDLGNETRDYLRPIIQAVPNFNTIGPDVAVFLSGPQGSSFVAGMAAESQWLMQLQVLAAKNPRFGYPDYPILFDFPMYLLDSVTQTDDERAAVQAFSAYLASNAQQSAAMSFGLRPASVDPTADQPLFASGAQYGIVSSLSTTNAVQLPQNPSGLRSFLTWFNQTKR